VSSSPCPVSSPRGLFGLIVFLRSALAHHMHRAGLVGPSNSVFSIVWDLADCHSRRRRHPASFDSCGAWQSALTAASPAVCLPWSWSSHARRRAHCTPHQSAVSARPLAIGTTNCTRRTAGLPAAAQCRSCAEGAETAQKSWPRSMRCGGSGTPARSRRTNSRH
jgi:hypothetical protein